MPPLAVVLVIISRTARGGAIQRVEGFIEIQYRTIGGISCLPNIELLKWTPQGLQKLKEIPSRLDAARKSFETAGVKMKDFYMVTGRYDMVLICEAPDEG